MITLKDANKMIKDSLEKNNLKITHASQQNYPSWICYRLKVEPTDMEYKSVERKDKLGDPTAKKTKKEIARRLNAMKAELVPAMAGLLDDMTVFLNGDVFKKVNGYVTPEIYFSFERPKPIKKAEDLKEKIAKAIAALEKLTGQKVSLQENSSDTHTVEKLLLH